MTHLGLMTLTRLLTRIGRALVVTGSPAECIAPGLRGLFGATTIPAAMLGWSLTAKEPQNGITSVKPELWVFHSLLAT